jgi:hypothetical protein
MPKNEFSALFECQEDMLRLHIADAIAVIGNNTDDIVALTNEAMRSLRHCGLLNAKEELAAFDQLQQLVIRHMNELRGTTQLRDSEPEESD